MIVKGFPEPYPDIKHSQPAADPANESTCNKAAQTGVGQEKPIISPFRSPGKNHQEHTHDGTDEHEQQDGKTM